MTRIKFLMGAAAAVAAIIVLLASDMASANDRMRMYSEKQRYDGWFNNLAHPDWGTIDSQLTRKTPPTYGDGVYTMNGDSRPSPRTLSQAFMKGYDGLGSLKNRTALATFFGQVVSAEILMASEHGCPIEMHRIPIEKCDEMYDEQCDGQTFMPFHRAHYDTKTGQSPNSPREQINRMTSWIDASFVYSTKEAWVNAMRTFRNGTFKMEEGGDPILGMPPRNMDRIPLQNHPAPHVLRMLPPERMFLLGDPRVNQNPALLAIGILFYRWHNVQASLVQAIHPTWADEDVFQAARRRVISTLQSLIMYEFLPSFIGKEASKYDGYKSYIHPGISHVFQSAAFRFGHTMIPPGIYRRDRVCDFKRALALLV